MCRQRRIFRKKCENWRFFEEKSAVSCEKIETFDREKRGILQNFH